MRCPGTGSTCMDGSTTIAQGCRKRPAISAVAGGARVSSDSVTSAPTHRSTAGNRQLVRSRPDPERAGTTLSTSMQTSTITTPMPECRWSAPIPSLLCRDNVVFYSGPEELVAKVRQVVANGKPPAPAAMRFSTGTIDGRDPARARGCRTGRAVRTATWQAEDAGQRTNVPPTSSL